MSCARQCALSPEQAESCTETMEEVGDSALLHCRDGVQVCEDVAEEVCNTVMEDVCQTVQEEECQEPGQPQQDCKVGWGGGVGC